MLVVNPAITYGLFEQLKKHIQKPTSQQVFLMGVFTKSLATMVTYPYILAKTKLQGDDQFKSTFALFLALVKRGGIKSLYCGLQEQLTKSVLGQALLFMLKDYLTKMYKFLAIGLKIDKDL